MNILSVFFTGTNNTAYVENLLLKKIKENDENNIINIKSINLSKQGENLQNVNLNEYEIFIIGSPVYMNVLPHKITNLIKKNFISGKNKKVILYSTSVDIGNHALYGLYKHLSKYNYDVICAVSFAMINNFYMSGIFKYTEQEQRKFNLEICNDKINIIANTILDYVYNNIDTNKFIDTQLNFFGYKTGLFIYKIAKIPYIYQYASKHFFVSNKCTKCKVCEKECPANNIEIIENKPFVKFKNKCYICTRCIHICPHNAITYKGKKIRKMNMMIP